MGSPSIPAQPAPPDYAAANREGITTDISTLPLRNKINQAAQLGQKVTYTDPATGEEKTADFTGMGNAAAAEQAAKILMDTNAAVQRQQLGLRQELGAANAAQTTAEIRAADPLAYDTRQDLTNIVRNRLLGEGPGDYRSAGMRDAAAEIARRAGQAPGADQRLGNIYDEATRLPGEARDASTGALNEGLQKALEEFRMGGKLSAEEKRDLLNETRAGQVARGNYLGDAAAIAEAVEMGKAGDARKAQRLQSLLDIQGRTFGQNTQLRGETSQNALNRIGTMSNLVGQDFGQKQNAYGMGLNAAQAAFGSAQATAGDERAARQENFGYDQQRLGNAQAVALGAPITNQFGSLGAAQQGAVGFTPVNFQGPGQLNPNAGAAGANFAQGNFGTQAGMWGTQADIASKGNPWMSLLGNAAGAAGGAAAAMLI